MLNLRRLSWICALSLVSCGGMEAEVATTEPEMTEPVRIETTAATFLVRDTVAADFEKLLAGEPTQHQYYAGE